MNVLLVILAALVLIGGCGAVVAPPANNTPSLPSAECNTDTDCAVGGCSSHVCTTAKAASDLMTTCEYKEEYGCLKLTSCGCVEGKCNWGSSPEYQECLSALNNNKN